MDQAIDDQKKKENISGLFQLKIRPLKAFTWIELGMCTICFLGAFLGTLKRYLPVSDTLITVSFDLLCFVLLGYVLMKRLVISGYHLPYSPLATPLFIFIGFTFLSIFVRLVPPLNQGLVGWRFLASSLLLHFLGFYAFDSVERIWRVMKVFWLSGCIVGIYGLVQYWRGYTAVELLWISNLAATMKIAGTGRYRIMSTMGSAVDLGFYLSLAMVTLFTALLLRKSRLWLWAMLFIMGVLLVLTYVRAAWIAVFLGFIYIVTIFLYRIKQVRVIYPIAVIVLLMLLSLLPFIADNIAALSNDLAFQERVGSLSNPFQDRSMIERFQKWKEIFAIILDNPLGVGVGMTGATRLIFQDEAISVPVTMDNSYLKILIETGWIGLGLFLWLLWSVFRKGKRILSKVHSDYYVLASMFIACFISFVSILFLGEYIELNPARSIVWIFSGFLFSLPRLQQQAEKSS